MQEKNAENSMLIKTTPLTLVFTKEKTPRISISLTQQSSANGNKFIFTIETVHPTGGATNNAQNANTVGSTRGGSEGDKCRLSRACHHPIHIKQPTDRSRDVTTNWARVPGSISVLILTTASLSVIATNGEWLEVQEWSQP